MGVQISEIIPRKDIEFSDLKGKVLAIDAFNSLYQFLTTIRQPDGAPVAVAAVWGRAAPLDLRANG